jgi:hypothetical protein
MGEVGGGGEGLGATREIYVSTSGFSSYGSNIAQLTGDCDVVTDLVCKFRKVAIEPNSGNGSLQVREEGKV